MPLVISEKSNTLMKIGDAYVAIEVNGGYLKVVIDAPDDQVIVRASILRDSLAKNGWHLEPNSFYANHAVHGRAHVRELEHMVGTIFERRPT